MLLFGDFYLPKGVSSELEMLMPSRKSWPSDHAVPRTKTFRMLQVYWSRLLNPQQAAVQGKTSSPPLSRQRWQDIKASADFELQKKVRVSLVSSYLL